MIDSIIAELEEKIKKAQGSPDKCEAYKESLEVVKRFRPIELRMCDALVEKSNEICTYKNAVESLSDQFKRMNKVIDNIPEMELEQYCSAINDIIDVNEKTLRATTTTEGYLYARITCDTFIQSMKNIGSILTKKRREATEEYKKRLDDIDKKDKDTEMEM